MTKFYIVSKDEVDTNVLESLPNFDIVLHDDDEEDDWFREALKHLEEESE